MAVTILRAGPLTTVQDNGRLGAGAQGFRTAGACDKHALGLANALVGNSLGDAVLEFPFLGPQLAFDADTVIALTGADMQPLLNGCAIPMDAPVAVQAGDVLTAQSAVAGLRGYLAVAGGFAVPPVMGSRSTDLQCALGGWQGRRLRDGDVLPTGPSSVPDVFRRAPDIAARLRQLADRHWLRGALGPWRSFGDGCIPLFRVVAGPQDDRFGDENLDTFARGIYTLTPECDRMGCKLNGPVLQVPGGTDILSDGIVEGSIQIAANGLPMVMLADHQTTGGYAKIGTVIRVDIARMAQQKPGDKVAFRFVPPEEGIAAWRREVAELRRIQSIVRTGKEESLNDY